MKFLTKYSQSVILQKGLVYKSSVKDKELRALLWKEQKGFCAYSEMIIPSLENCQIEHFNRALKYKDNYYNYYAVDYGVHQRKTQKEKEARPLPTKSASSFRMPFSFPLACATVGRTVCTKQ